MAKAKGKAKVRVLAFGAHQDDCDIKLGGMAILYARLGHAVKFISVTNGDTGHYAMGGGPLARRRTAEAEGSAKVAGIEYEVFDIHNNGLEPNLANRQMVIRAIREFEPDLVITHRPNDYHPDHRYTSQLVQDSAYTVTVPNVAALTPHLMKNPVIAYMSDDFRRPYPFAADVVVAIDDVVDRKVRMLACHESQFFEWLPYNAGVKRVPPASRPAERRRFIMNGRSPKWAETADKYRDVLVRLYGEKRGSKVRYAEALEICEYGSPVTDANRDRLFPFFA